MSKLKLSQEKKNHIIGIRKLLRSLKFTPTQITRLEARLELADDKAVALANDVLFEVMTWFVETADDPQRVPRARQLHATKLPVPANKKQLYRVWCNTPHYVEVEADSENDARELAAEITFKDLEAGWAPDDIMGHDMQDDVELVRTKKP